MRDKLENPNDKSDDDQLSVDETTELNSKKPKKKKPGIIYLSAIPKYMTAAYLKEFLSDFGEVGRVYLQDEVKDGIKTGKKKKKRKMSRARNYSEGWVEFKSKRVAKEVASVLNNTQIGGRKKSAFYDYIWIIKYLPRFKWTHLTERLTYERAVRKQRMRTEINQAKREADYFSLNVDHSENLKKLSKGQKTDYDISQVKIPQRETEEQIVEKKNIKNYKAVSKDNISGSRNANDRDNFLKTLFS